MRRLCILAIAFPLLGSALRAQEPPTPVAVEPSGIVPVDLERRVILDGLAGDLVIQVGKPGEIRFQSRKMGKKDDLPLALFAQGNTLIFRPPEGEAFTARTFQLSVPPEILVRVQAPGGGKLTVSGLRGGLEVAGRALNVDARGLGCNVDLEMQGGTAIVSSLAGDVRVRGAGANVTFDNVRGAVTLATSESAATVRGAGSLEADIDGVTLKVEGVKGAVIVNARGGTIEAVAMGQGGQFKLSGTPLVMAKSKGDITISSDADVQFTEMEADLHLDVYGGSVRGSGNQGILEVRARNAAVTIEKNTGAVRVQGDGLTVKLSDVGGEAYVAAVTSDVTLDNIGGAITVEAERGDLVVTRASHAVQAKASGGNVRMTDMNGPVNLTADGNMAEIAWASMPDKDSKITNEGGEVVVRFPPSGTGCKIEAHSTSGRIETDLPHVQLLDDGSRAVGRVGNAQRPNVYIEADRDIRLSIGGAAPAE